VHEKGKATCGWEGRTVGRLQSPRPSSTVRGGATMRPSLDSARVTQVPPEEGRAAVLGREEIFLCFVKETGEG